MLARALFSTRSTDGLIAATSLMSGGALTSITFVMRDDERQDSPKRSALAPEDIDSGVLLAVEGSGDRWMATGLNESQRRTYAGASLLVLPTSSPLTALASSRPFCDVDINGHDTYLVILV